MEKQYISANKLLTDAYRLAKKVFDSGFNPNFIVALWRGGTPVGCAVQEFLAFKGIKTDHISIRTSGYTGIGEMEKQVKVHGMEYIMQTINNTDKLLIVDDVFDSGLTIEAVFEKLKKEARANMPAEIKVAAVYYKPTKNKTKKKPDFYIHETDKWLVFPHELNGLSLKEIAKEKGEEIAELVK